MSTSAQKVINQEDPELTNVVHSEGAAQRKVLLVDEQAHILRVIRMNLGRHGYEVDMALSVENALCLIRENHYDVVIITSDLPDMSAKRLCEKLEHQLVNNRPLILVGAREDEETWLDSSEVAERLDVPVSLRWIVARLSEAFGDYN
ncbi:MAG: PleD family two-component system response regulator [Granulosicoccus sp.]